MKLKIASPIIYDSIVDGPGLRMVVWTQGCIHKCKGCHNPQTHSFNGGYYIDTNDIIKQMKQLKLQRGITFSGGEPFLQPEPLIEIAKKAKEIGLDIWIYTGFTFEELININNISYFENIGLLKYTDILVDGKFIEEQKDISLLFRGSLNQRIIDVKKSMECKAVILDYKYMNREVCSVINE